MVSGWRVLATAETTGVTLKNDVCPTWFDRLRNRSALTPTISQAIFLSTLERLLCVVVWSARLVRWLRSMIICWGFRARIWGFNVKFRMAKENVALFDIRSETTIPTMSNMKLKFNRIESNRIYDNHLLLHPLNLKMVWLMKSKRRWRHLIAYL